MKIRRHLAIAAAWAALMATAFAAGTIALQGNAPQTARTSTVKPLLAEGDRTGAVATAQQTARKPLSLKTSVGGDLSQPLVYGTLVYVPAGRGLSIWNYASPAAPVLVGSTPMAPGVIQGLARHGKYLYVSW